MIELSRRWMIQPSSTKKVFTLFNRVNLSTVRWGVTHVSDMSFPLADNDNVNITFFHLEF